MPKKKKARTVPRRLNNLAPLMIRGTRIYVLDSIHCPANLEEIGQTCDPPGMSLCDWAESTMKQLQRGEVCLFNGMMARPGRRGRWEYQLSDGQWTEVRWLDEIPWRFEDPYPGAPPEDPNTGGDGKLRVLGATERLGTS